MADNMGEHLLNRINFPADLHQLSEEQLPEVCAELRQYIIDVLSENPGHLGASLGTVELLSPCTTYLMRRMIGLSGT